MHFSTDGLADIINGLLVNILSAILIFAYIWYVKKKPAIKVYYSFSESGFVNMTTAKESRSLELVLWVSNQSIYIAYNFVLTCTDYNGQQRNFNFDKINIGSNEEVEKRFNEKVFNLEGSNLEEFEVKIKKILNKPLAYTMEFRNEENKHFKISGIATQRY